MLQPEPAHFAALLTVFRNLYTISPEAEMFLQQHVIACSIGKRKLLLREGERCEHIYFVGKGALRGFTREDQKDITTWITIENELVTSILGLDEQMMSIENIQALEKCELLAMTYKDLNKMYELFPEVNILARKLFARYYADAEKRAFIARLTKAENKYRYFLLRHRDLANRIPLKYIASYLGVTLETLSRTRKKFSSKS
jgi:CRP-like cAMP-binding protein